MTNEHGARFRNHWCMFPKNDETNVATSLPRLYRKIRGRCVTSITGLGRGYLSQSSKLYGVLEASEHSFYSFLNRFGAVCSKISGVQKTLRPVMVTRERGSMGIMTNVTNINKCWKRTALNTHRPIDCYYQQTEWRLSGFRDLIRHKNTPTEFYMKR